MTMKGWRTKGLPLLLPVALSVSLADAFFLPQVKNCVTTTRRRRTLMYKYNEFRATRLNDDNHHIPSAAPAESHPNRRRILLWKLPIAVFPFLLPANNNDNAHAAMMINSQTVFEVGKALTVDQAEARFKEGRESIQYLLDHYDEICAAGGGDNVRRYLGTVGTSSGLYGIGKVMKVLLEDEDRVEDVVEYTETVNEVNQSIQQADGSAYMAIFATTSTSYTPSEKYFADAKVEIKNCIQAMDKLAAQIGI
jgi:hypothetical protein